MTERIAFTLLAIVTVVLGYNFIEASNRFGDAAETFDGLTFNLESFDWRGLDQPVDFTVDYLNPSGQALVVQAVEYTLVANGETVGGGASRDAVEVSKRGHAPLSLHARIAEPRSLADYSPGDEVNWLVLARTLIEVDADLDPVWVNYSFREVTH